jgi:hypothetical protein
MVGAKGRVNVKEEELSRYPGKPCNKEEADRKAIADVLSYFMEELYGKLTPFGGDRTLFTKNKWEFVTRYVWRVVRYTIREEELSDRLYEYMNNYFENEKKKCEYVWKADRA